MGEQQPALLALGAHPDDCDIKAGGLAILYSQKGYRVKFVSLTNGDAGHQELGGATLAKRRGEECRHAGLIAGIEYITLDNHDGELEANLENRKKIIRLIREFKPTLILTHRPNDYHPDHRYTATLVQDSAYMVTVPNICADTPPLEYNPVIGYFSDDFQKPVSFVANVAVGIDDVIPKKLDMLHCHGSQMYEWLPFNSGTTEEVPMCDTERRIWLENKYLKEMSAEPYRSLLLKLYGDHQGKAIKYAEAFEIGEYGSPLNEQNLNILFPFYR